MSKREQYWDALDRANEVRYAQAEMRQEMKAVKPMDASCKALADALETSDPLAEGYADYLRNVTCLRYLKWGHRVGVQRANAILREAVVPPHKTLSSLTPRERQSLAGVLRRAERLETTDRESLTWAEQVVGAPR